MGRTTIRRRSGRGQGSRASADRVPGTGVLGSFRRIRRAGRSRRDSRDGPVGAGERGASRVFGRIEVGFVSQGSLRPSLGSFRKTGRRGSTGLATRAGGGGSGVHIC